MGELRTFLFLFGAIILFGACIAAPIIAWQRWELHNALRDHMRYGAYMRDPKARAPCLRRKSKIVYLEQYKNGVG